MSRVTVGAHGRHYQAALQEALAMNAHGIAAHVNRLAACRSPHGRRATGNVALTAKIRHIGWKGRRLWIAPVTDIVTPVTIYALGSIRVATFGQTSVSATGKGFHYLGVTDSTVHALSHGSARTILAGADTGMALGTSFTAMNRAFDFKAIYK